MTDPGETPDRSAVAPFLGALTIILAVVIGIFLINVFSGDDLTDEQQIARAASGQNDALQRLDYGDYREFTCAGQLRDEAKVLAEQNDSVQKRGGRFIDRVAGVAIDGDRASADITYYFDNDTEAKETVAMTFTREDGAWKVCSTGPK
ncbi:lumazine-binding protein [Mycobacterium sp. ITM-2017-0098]|nr:lumazine-binding protein [Mycobacterium sp. ITM-2017-0098]